MRRLLPLSLLALAPLSASAQEPPTRPVPALPGRAPKVDGNLRDFGAGAPLKSAPADGASASFTGKVAWRQGTLYVAVDLKDKTVTAEDDLSLTLFFPGSGPTSTGYTWHIGPEGLLPVGPDALTPEFAQSRLEVGAKKQGDKLGVEVAIPARSFPRFPAKEPLVLDVCLTYDDKDPDGAGVPVSNCKEGSMVGEALKLPDDFRKGLKLKVPDSVLTLESVEHGWLGWDLLHYPAWVQGDEPLTANSLREMVASDRAYAAGAHLDIPDALTLQDGRPLLTVVAGRDPYAVQGKCDAEKELRLGVYLVTGNTAQRALEWPAATCALGRAQSVGMDEEGALIIRYSNGATINFAWSGDHFERTELGNR